MSYYDEQEDAWMANDCRGRIEDYDPYDPDSWPQPKKSRPKPRAPLHCLNCGAAVRDNGLCPNATGDPRKVGKMTALVNCGKGKGK